MRNESPMSRRGASADFSSGRSGRALIDAHGRRIDCLRSPDGRFALGFITPLSRHLCANRNRVRLSAKGMPHGGLPSCEHNANPYRRRHA